MSEQSDSDSSDDDEHDDDRKNPTALVNSKVVTVFFNNTWLHCFMSGNNNLVSAVDEWFLRF